VEAEPGALAAGAAAAAAHAEHGATVVLLALLRVAHDVVGRLDLLEALLGLVVAGIAVRVVLARQLAVGLLDLLGRGLLVDPEDRVRVPPATPPRAGRSTSSPRRYPFCPTSSTVPGRAPSPAGCWATASWKCGSNGSPLGA